MEIVFLVEEASAANLLKTLLPSMLPSGLSFRVLAHRGKSDLKKSIPRKLREWRTPDTCFVVLHDQDGRDCLALKDELRQLCHQAGRPDTLVRIVCQELEAWYFGDVEALAEVYGEGALAKIRGKAPFRVPDRIAKPSRELERLIPEFQKGSASESIPGFMLPERNVSQSFQQFRAGIGRLCANT